MGRSAVKHAVFQMCIAFTLKLTAVRVPRRKLHKINPRRSVNPPEDTVAGVKELRNEGENGMCWEVWRLIGSRCM